MDEFYKKLLIDLNKYAMENTTCKKVAVRIHVLRQ